MKCQLTSHSKCFSKNCKKIIKIKQTNKQKQPRIKETKSQEVLEEDSRKEYIEPQKTND